MSKKNYPKKMPIIYKSGNKKSANISQEIDKKKIPDIICYNKKTGENYNDNLYLINELHKNLNYKNIDSNSVNNKILINTKNNNIDSVTSNKISKTTKNIISNTVNSSKSSSNISNIHTNILMESKNVTNDNINKSTDMCYNKSREELCEENYYILNEYSKLRDELENCKTKSINNNSNANTDGDGITVRSIYQIIPRSYDAALVVAKYAGLNPNNLILDYFNSKPYAEITQREYFNNSNNLNSCLDMFKFILLIFLLYLLFQIKKV